MEKIVNLEKGILKLYNLKTSIGQYELKCINYYVALTGKKEHIEGKTSSDSAITCERGIFDIVGDEKSIITNVNCKLTGNRFWDCYDEYKREVIVNYDKYITPDLYKVLGAFIEKNSSGEYYIKQRIEALRKLNEYFVKGKFEGKTVFDCYKDKIYNGIYLEEIKNNYIAELNQLYKMLFMDHEELKAFNKKKFNEIYNVQSYDFENIKKVIVKRK